MNKDKVSVSICVLFYNHEKYVEETLTSLVSQDYDSFEIVIRDDCSKDNTQAKIREFVEKNSHIKIKVDYGTKNLGIVPSLNRVFEMAEGGILMLQGGDDISKSDRMKKSVALLKKYDVDLVAVDAYMFNDSGTILRKSFLNVSGLEDEVHFEHSLKIGEKKKLEDKVYFIDVRDLKDLGGLCFGGFGLCFNRSVLDFYDGKLPENMFYEDRFITFLANAGKGIVLLMEQLVGYRRTGYNSSMPTAISENEKIEASIRIKLLESEVCKAQIEYFNQGGTIKNHRISEKAYLKSLYFELYRNYLSIKLVKAEAVNLKKSYIINEFLKVATVNWRISSKYLAASVYPELFKKKFINDYNMRKSFFVN